MSTSPTSAPAGHRASVEDHAVLSQRSRSLRWLIVAIIVIACTAAVARGTSTNDKSQNDGHPSLRQRIACMC